ncbi:hypothetical protein [Salinicoccus halitifaciens]|uniref:Uncharacterized protein n=1 Tax=Salinicoccus halitifaciens TaxID=1073415 RepID=A0ABV2E5T0_9STAP|nr:hypothetical protein [Salinicoccus halitifaciens]MCD2137182.1 hypothetical protein [Salinicoccus halitifaciens]
MIREELFDSIKNNLQVDDNIEKPKEEAIFVVMDKLYNEYKKFEDEFRDRDIPYSVGSFPTTNAKTNKIVSYNNITVSVGKDSEIRVNYNQMNKAGVIHVNLSERIDAVKSDVNTIVFTDGTNESYQEHVVRMIEKGNALLEESNKRYKK